MAGGFPYVLCGHAGELMMTNTMVNWMFNLFWQCSIPALPYWILTDTVIMVVSIFVGVGVLIGLRKARLPQYADQLEK